jgi:3,4-dihydroxy 2-butanone 4-phosphate synthase/GTP cyclohydrolase II
MTLTAMVDEMTVGPSGSAVGRSRTARALADLATSPGDLSLSGNTPVVTSRNGGVLECPGRAEAAVDLLRLARLAPAGVLTGISSDDALGMAYEVELDSLENRYGLVSVRIAELVRYRRRVEGVVRRRAEARIPTELGDFRCVAYDGTSEEQSYVALVWGDVSCPDPVFVGFHTESVVDDVFGGSVVGCRSRLYNAMRSISLQMAGVLVYVRSDGVLGAGKPNLSNGATGAEKDAAAQILVDLGVQEVSLLPGGESYVETMSTYGFRISGHVSAEVP